MYKRSIISIFCIITILGNSIFLPQVFSNDPDCAEKEKAREDVGRHLIRLNQVLRNK